MTMRNLLSAPNCRLCSIAALPAWLATATGPHVRNEGDQSRFLHPSGGHFQESGCEGTRGTLNSDMSIGHQVGVQCRRAHCLATQSMAMSGLSFLDEMASMNGISADASLAEDEEKLFNLFFSDGLEPSLGLQASGDFPELTSITEPSDTAEDSAEALAPPPPPQSRRKEAPQRSLKAASQSQEKSRCGICCLWHRKSNVQGQT